MECVTCVCVWLWAVWVERGGEWMRELGLGFTNAVGTGGVLDMCLGFGCGGVHGEWVGGLDQGRERWEYIKFCLVKLSTIEFIVYIYIYIYILYNTHIIMNISQ